MIYGSFQIRINSTNQVFSLQSYYAAEVSDSQHQPFDELVVFLFTYCLERFVPVYIWCLQPPGIRTESILLALRDAWTTGIKWYSYVSQANNRRANEYCPRTELSNWVLHPYPSIHAFISILSLKFLNVTVVSFKCNKRLKLCSITFCSQINFYTIFFLSLCFHTNCFSEQQPSLHLKSYPPKMVFHRML